MLSPSEGFLVSAVAVLAVVLTGLSKGGFAGVGAIATPMLALAMGPTRAAAVLLPILILQDMLGVWAFRKSFDRRILMTMLPGAAVGVACAALFARHAPRAWLMIALGLISLLFGLYRLVWSRPGLGQAAAESDGSAREDLIGALLGAVSGFSSQIAHAGQPPFQIWAMRRRIDPETLIGTSAIYYAALNWMKLPAFATIGQLTRQNLTLSLWLAPMAVASTLAGVWLVRRLDARKFRGAIFSLMILVGVVLIGEGVAQLAAG